VSTLRDLASHVLALGRDAEEAAHELESLTSRVEAFQSQLSSLARAGVDVREVQQSLATSVHAAEAGASSAIQAAQLATQFADSLVGIGGGGSPALASAVGTVGVDALTRPASTQAATRAAVRIAPNYRSLTGKTVLGFRDPDDRACSILGWNQRNLHPITGYHDVFTHGSPTSVTDDLGEDLTAKELAEIIRASGQWDGKEAIRLVSCETGSGPFAQELADELGVPVLAPLKKVCSSNSGKNLMESGDKVAEMVTRYPQ